MGITNRIDNTNGVKNLPRGKSGAAKALSQRLKKIKNSAEKTMDILHTAGLIAKAKLDKNKKGELFKEILQIAGTIEKLIFRLVTVHSTYVDMKKAGLSKSEIKKIFTEVGKKDPQILQMYNSFDK